MGWGAGKGLALAGEMVYTACMSALSHEAHKLLSPKEMNFVIEYTKDFRARRAAQASGYCADMGYKLRDEPHIRAAVEEILTQRLEAAHIDAQWVLLRAADNYKIALQDGNISASNTALKLIAQHCMVDAMASDKLNVNLNNSREIIDRLTKGRKRASCSHSKPPVIESGETPSFL